MTFVSSWRTALRIARREARRSKGRSALVIAMIGMPVLCLSFAASSYDMFTLTGDERANQLMGTADARVRMNSTDPVEQDVNATSYWTTRAEPPSSDTPAASGDVVKPDKKTAPTQADVLAKLPSGTRALSVRTGSITLRTVDGVGNPNAISVDAKDPLTQGYLKVLKGRSPETPYEVALTEQAVTRLGQGLGGKVESPDGKRSYTVVGIVEFPSMLEQVVLLAPITGTSPDGVAVDDQSWLVDTPGPVTWAQVRQANTYGISVASREVFNNPPPPSEVPNQFTGDTLRPQDLAVPVIVAGLALLEIVLLAGPAFAVSARRRQRQLALVGANGGTPAHIRRIVLADGVVLGVVGALVGIVVGVAVAFLARPYVETYLTHSRGGAYRVFPVALVAITVLAVFTGVMAALVPAFITARQNVVASLAGRRGTTRSKKRWIVLGVALIAIGAAIAVAGSLVSQAWVLLGGFVAAELGLVLCTPALVGFVAKFGRLLPLAPRIALRDAARNRAAAAPAISAVMAAVAGSVAIGLNIQSNIVLQQDLYQANLPTGYVSVYAYGKDDTTAPPSTTDVDRALRSTLPIVDVKLVHGFSCGDSAAKGTICQVRIALPKDLACPYEDLIRTTGQLSAEQQRSASADQRCQRRFSNDFVSRVDDGTALPVLTGATSSDIAAATATLRSGGIVLGDESYVRDGKAQLVIETIDTTSNTGVPTGVTMTFPAYVLHSGVVHSVIVSPAAVVAAGLRVSTVDHEYVASTSRVPTEAESDKFTKRMSDLAIGGRIERGPQIVIPVELWIIMAAAALITLGAAAIGTGLAAADRRADLSTLAAVGASPRLRRGLSLSQSAVIAGLGSVLGAAAGMGAAIAIVVALNQRWANLWPAPTPKPIVVPWLSLGVALVLVPLVAILGAGMLTRSRLPIERRI